MMGKRLSFRVILGVSVVGLGCTRATLTEELRPYPGYEVPAEESPQPAGPVAPTPDGLPVPPHIPGSCTPLAGEPNRAIVLTLNNEGKPDQIAVLTLTSAGKLVDSGIRFDIPSNPRQVTMRPDGREAAVAFGTIHGDVGITVLSLEPDGTDSALLQTLVVAQQQLTTGIAYVSQDKVVLTAAGRSAHNFYAVERGADGQFVQGPTTPIPGGFAVQVIARPGTERAVLVRAALSETFSELLPIARWQNGWVSAGLSGRVVPKAVTAVVHPAGNRVYVGTDAPNATAPVPAGQLHSFHFSGEDLVGDPPFPLARTAQVMASAPDGSYLVAQVPLLQPSASGSGYSVDHYQLQTIALDNEGNPRGTPVLSDDTFGALFIHSLVITPAGYLIAALELHPHQIVDNQAYPIKVFEQVSPGQWRQVCDTYWASGQATVGIATFPVAL